MKVLRFLRIMMVALRFGLDDILLVARARSLLRPWTNRLLFWRDLSTPRAVRLRLALEELGPIFVKFGQMLSTRRDLLPTDIADELAKLQDRVPPFPAEEVIATLERALSAGRSTRCSRSSSASRWRARRSRKCTSRSFPTARPSPSRCCARASRR